jgi:hypothetical protein
MQAALKTKSIAFELATLRAQLSDRFGSAGGGTAPARNVPAPLPTGIPSWDAAGGLQQGQLTEACGGTADGALLLESILRQSPHRISALIDTADSLEPADWPPRCMARMLWVRCNAIKQALHATDLLLRDGNFHLLALNLQGLPERQLAEIPSSTWHRFHRLLKHHCSALLVISPHPLVEGARTRVASAARWDLSALDTPRAILLEDLSVSVFRRGAGPRLLTNEPACVLDN